MAADDGRAAGRGERAVLIAVSAALTLSLGANVFLAVRLREHGKSGQDTAEQGKTSEAPEAAPSPEGRLENAVAELLKAERPPTFYASLARILSAEECDDEAAALLAKASELSADPSAKARLLGEFGKTLVKAGKPKDGLDAFARAIEVSPDPKQKVSLASTLGRLAERYGTPEEALAAHQFVVEHADQDWVRDLSRRAILRLKEETGAISAHLAALEARLKDNPKDVAALEVLADYHRRQKQDPKAAIVYYERPVAAQPDDPKRLRELADCCLETQDYDRAAAVYQKGLAADPESAAYYLECLSRTCAAKGDDAMARDWALKLADSKPDDALVLAKAADLLAAAHDTDAALVWMDKALAAATSDTQRAHLLLGAAGLADRLKKPDLAESYYKRILDLSVPPMLRDRAQRGLRVLAQKRRAREESGIQPSSRGAPK